MNRILLGALVLIASACGPDGSDQETTGGARLTTRGAGELLFDPDGGGRLESPLGGPGEDVTLDSLGVDFGTPEAALRLIEFYDYGCGFCRSFHLNTRTPLHEQYVDAGKVYWKSIPFVTGNWPESIPVSLAAECARAQGRDEFVAISDLIFDRQPEWKSASEPEAVVQAFAEEAGLDMESYQTCIDGDEFVWRVRAQTMLAQELGVRGTPTFFLIGVGPINGALPLETFQQIFDTVLVEAAAGRF